jgi:acetylornithine deacetylase
VRHAERPAQLAGASEVRLSDPQLVSLARELLSVDSPSGAEGAVTELAAQLLEHDGWQVQRIPVGPGRHSLLASPGGRDFKLTFSTHLDTVPPYIPPRLEGETLWGRGACDAKGIAAAMMVAARRLRDRGLPVALLLVVGEETAHDGARAANDWAAKNLPPGVPRALVNGEPTGNRLAVGTKGALRVQVRVEGRAAHSAYPEMGCSAIAELVRMLAQLEALPFPEDPLLGRTTVNIGSIAGGVADNVLAPEATARLMFRLVTPAEQVRPLLEQWAAGRAHLEWGVYASPQRLAVLGGFETCVVAYTTDIGALTNWGTPYLLGPGSIELAHSDQERIALRELERGVELYEELAVAVLRDLSVTVASE